MRTPRTSLQAGCALFWLLCTGPAVARLSLRAQTRRLGRLSDDARSETISTASRRSELSTGRTRKQVSAHARKRDLSPKAGARRPETRRVSRRTQTRPSPGSSRPMSYVKLLHHAVGALKISMRKARNRSAEVAQYLDEFGRVVGCCINKESA